MVKIVDFVVIFDDGVKKRHHHETEKGTVAYFAVQLEIRVKDEWLVVLRYDCSHDFSHMDKYDIKGKQTKRLLNLSFESALTFHSLKKIRVCLILLLYKSISYANALIFALASIK